MELRKFFQRVPPPDDEDTQPLPAKKVEVLVSVPVGALVVHPSYPDDDLIVSGHLDDGYLVAVTFYHGGRQQAQPYIVVIRPAREFVVIQ